MEEKDLLEYFNANYDQIIDTMPYEVLNKLFANIKDKRIEKLIRNMPESIRVSIAEKYLTEISHKSDSFLNQNSWDDFYEMYDGKFDEKHMLHITILAQYKDELTELGYSSQREEDDWHKPEAGEYKIDDEGNLIIIHSCPDREIFEIEAKQYLEDLYLNSKWVSETTFSIM